MNKGVKNKWMNMIIKVRCMRFFFMPTKQLCYP